MRTTTASVLAVLPDFGLALLALVTWADPEFFGTHFVRFFLMLMLLEFIVVHSAAFMGAVAFSDKPAHQRALSVLGLGAFYSLFAGGFALSFRSWWPLVTFWLLTLNRLLGVLLGQAPKGKEGDFVKAGWAAGALFYLLSVMVATVIPWPRLGVRPGMVGDLAASSGGQWVDEPHRALVAAVLYFGLITWTGANGFAWFAKHVPRGS